MPGYQILTYNKTGILRARPMREWTSIDVTLRFNEPGSGVFSVPGYSVWRDAILPGGRIVVTWRPTRTSASQVLIAGPITETMYERGDDGEHAGAGTLTVNFSDDLSALASRVVYPDPRSNPEDWLVDYYSRTGTVEGLMRELVNLNAGQSALGPRQVLNLAIGPAPASTTSGTVNTRLEMMLDVLRSLAAQAGLGFRTTQVGTTVVFEVYLPADRSSSVRYSFDLGNVRYLSYRQQAPTATTALVGGQGEAADRFVTSVTNATDEASWTRSETYVARAGGLPTLELEEEGNKALLDTRSTAQLTATTIDSANQRFGVHYGLGDTVSVSPFTGTELVAQVKTVHIQAWATAGELITPTIGDQSISTATATVQRLRDIDRRVRYLERNTVPPA